jgi:hypothetical protein
MSEQLLGSLGSSVARKVSRRCDHAPGRGRESPHSQARIGHVAHPQGDVNPLGNHADIAIIEDTFELQTRVRIQEFTEQRNNVQARESHWSGDLQPTGEPLGRTPRRGLSVIESFERYPCMLVIAYAGLGGGHPTSGPDEQLNTQRAFQ